MHFCEASPTLALDNVKKEAILRDFLNFWSSQHQKRSNSARLPQFLKLASSKNEAVLRDFFQDNGKLSAELTASCQCVLQFSSPCLWSIAPATKKWCQVIQSAAPVTQNHLPKTEDLMFQMQPLSRNQRPDLLTSLMNMFLVSLVLHLPQKMHLSRSSSNVPPLPVFGNARKPSRFAHFWQGAESLAPATRNNIWTSKSGPNMLCFLHPRPQLVQE